MYRATDRGAETEALLRRALSIRESSLGPDATRVPETLEVYAALLPEWKGPES